SFAQRTAGAIHQTSSLRSKISLRVSRFWLQECTRSLINTAHTFTREESVEMYPRDLKGHGRMPPQANWPGGAKLAVQFVINYEEGGEHSVLHGDRHSEAWL